MLSVIIPAYNRRDNLVRCLTSLYHQEGSADFEVVVVDDGSTDHTFEMLDERCGFSSQGIGYLKFEQDHHRTLVRYFSGGPNKGFRGGRARNIGAFNASGDLFVFVDSDVVLHKGALAAYAKAHRDQPSAVVVGQYDWLPPLTWMPETAHLLWESASYEELMTKCADAGVVIDQSVQNDTPFGKDVRWQDFSDDLTALRKDAGLGSLSGNIGYPSDLFWKLGGFDERIIGHGGEDADLGLTAGEAGAEWLFYRPIIGYHLWHPRNQEVNSREVQANITYIDAKHGVGQYKNAKKWVDAQNWSDPIHYHRHLGAILVKTADNPTVCVYRDGHYLKLSSQNWLKKLGFTWQDLEIVEPSFLETAKHEGDAIDDGLPAEAKKVVAIEIKETKVGPRVTSFAKAKGAKLWRVDGQNTVYLVKDGWRMGIATPDWLTWLGFIPDDVELIGQSAVDKLLDAGQTPPFFQTVTGEIKRED